MFSVTNQTEKKVVVKTKPEKQGQYSVEDKTRAARF